MRVFILTYCRNPALLSGTTLVFRTLRTGFPTADVLVADNASVAEARPAIQAAAAAAGCRFQALGKQIAHHAFIERVIEDHDGPLAFVDPDVMFWEPCEGWRFDALLAGRLIPAFDDEFSATVTAARLHTSFLLVPDAARLRDAIAGVRASHWDFEPFRPFAYRCADGWRRLDCGASLYAALPGRCLAFSDAELDAYDHLFLGSHVDQVAPCLPAGEARELLAIHAQAAEDPARLRGLWRRQQAYFERRRR